MEADISRLQRTGHFYFALTWEFGIACARGYSPGSSSVSQIFGLRVVPTAEEIPSLSKVTVPVERLLRSNFRCRRIVAKT